VATKLGYDIEAGVEKNAPATAASQRTISRVISGEGIVETANLGPQHSIVPWALTPQMRSSSMASEL
jgi:hypothetical protein